MIQARLERAVLRHGTIAENFKTCGYCAVEWRTATGVKK
jgi:hypothetical protein